MGPKGGWKIDQARWVVFTLLLFMCACGLRPVSPGLVSTAELGSLRGQHFVRAITHFHTPFSFDACDGKGLASDGSVNLECLHDAKEAFCENHINFIFATDHVSKLSETAFDRLAHLESGDAPILNSASEVRANQIACSNGFSPVLSVGLEGKLLALGMEKHVPGDQAAREAVYLEETPAAKAALEADPNALVGVPHTEGKDLAALIALDPKFIEIYNLHANLDPRIRKKYLHRNPFDKIGVFINFLIDPYRSLNPDYMFMDFIEYNQVYFDMWDGLLAAGKKPAGVGGLDSHENIFRETGADGQRLDHHRRMTRIMNNFVLTPSDTIDAVKTAIASRRVYFVLEGMGTPVGLDFRGELNGAVTEIGGEMVVGPLDSAKLIFQIPSVLASFPGMEGDERPEISAELIRVDSGGKETVVSRSSSSTLEWNDPAAGFYRVRVTMIPRHLRELVFNEDRAEAPETWIITNHIQVSR